MSSGLANCSSSYHGAGLADQYAYDIEILTGDDRHYLSSKSVLSVVENQPSGRGGIGNYVVIDHGDNTFALYQRSPEDGIIAAEQTIVDQGDTRSFAGRSGLAGYSHLHFVVTEGFHAFRYRAIPSSFSNAMPVVVPTRTNRSDSVESW